MAAMRADELVAQGDIDGAATFERIVGIITEIGRERRANEAMKLGHVETPERVRGRC